MNRVKTKGTKVGENKDKLTKLKQRQADLQLRIRREEKKLADGQRRRDTRRKILAGAIALEEAESNPAWRTRLVNCVDETVTSPSDRALFGLK